MKTQVLLFALLVLAVSPSFGNQGTKKTTVTQPETRKIVQAIQDEVYDYEYEGHYFPEGGPVGDVVSSSRTRVPLYIDPTIEDGEGQLIYKLMPYGEVLRLFHVHDDGTVVLDGDPEIGFPASQPNRKTVYLKDDDVCRMKHEWLRSSFEVDLSPSPERVQDAVRRQKQRNDGFSEWEFARSKGDKKLP
jgi:hypothetical protein